MSKNRDYTVLQRFLKYVRIDTEADPASTTFPSSSKQLLLTKILLDELAEMGVKTVTNEAGYVYGYLPSNVRKTVPKVFFCAHIDTAPDCSGKNVKPLVHHNYQGQEIILPDDPAQIITSALYPNLKCKTGHDIVTASGTTLLGSDDKSGVAIIMDAIFQMVKHPELPHGEVRILLTTDEEIGKGVAKVSIEQLDADFGYTLDSGDLGCFEAENFSADALTLRIVGVSAHPGYAKGKMQNAIKIASEIVSSLPKDLLTPETTEEKEGFIHPTKIQGSLENAQIDFILRDFDTEKLTTYATMIERISKEVTQKYPGSSFTTEVKKQYRNMKDVLDKNPHVISYAIRAMENLNIPVQNGAIRGGTDGAVLSHMGLPCPNLFAGEQAIHSKHEWVSVQDMQQSVDTIIEICRLITEE